MRLPFSPSTSSTAAALLVFAFGSFVYGHIGSSHLNPLTDYISNYAATANRWPWICAAIISFGLVLFALAYQINRVPMNRALAAASICFSVSATSMVFVACYPTARLKDHDIARLSSENTKSGPEIKEAVGEAYRRGWDKAYSDAHFDMISVSTVSLALGMALCGLGLATNGMWKAGSSLTYLTVVILIALFATGRISSAHGLFQRLGFLGAWSWVLCATWNHGGRARVK
jgi:hypothetical protein